MVKLNPKSARVNMVNAAEAENSSDMIMGNLFVNDFLAKVLFDSGASHCFMSKSFGSKHDIPTIHLDNPFRVVSPGMRMSSHMVVPYVSVKMGRYSFLASPIVLRQSYADLILGLDWLAMNKVYIDCEAKKVKLTHSSEDLIIFATRDDTICLFPSTRRVKSPPFLKFQWSVSMKMSFEKNCQECLRTDQFGS